MWLGKTDGEDCIIELHSSNHINCGDAHVTK
jgi:hypothetical protein